jgi:hypothetical protein
MSTRWMLTSHGISAKWLTWLNVPESHTEDFVVITGIFYFLLWQIGNIYCSLLWTTVLNYLWVLSVTNIAHESHVNRRKESTHQYGTVVWYKLKWGGRCTCTVLVPVPVPVLERYVYRNSSKKLIRQLKIVYYQYAYGRMYCAYVRVHTYCN